MSQQNMAWSIIMALPCGIFRVVVLGHAMACPYNMPFPNIMAWIINMPLPCGIFRVIVLGFAMANPYIMPWPINMACPSSIIHGGVRLCAIKCILLPFGWVVQYVICNIFKRLWVANNVVVKTRLPLEIFVMVFVAPSFYRRFVLVYDGWNRTGNGFGKMAMVWWWWLP